MKERPILFSAPMVRALLDGSKTQTRRPVKGIALSWLGADLTPEFVALPENHACPCGQPGDHLWVRETFFAYGRWETRYSEKKGREEWHFIDMTLECDRAYQYAADNPDVPIAVGRGPMPGWWKRPAIFMPRAACRAVPEIVAVRIERLNDCSSEDARAEGVLWDHMGWMDYAHADGRRKSSSLQSYETLWESINGAGSWAANTWIWVVELKRVVP